MAILTNKIGKHFFLLAYPSIRKLTHTYPNKRGQNPSVTGCGYSLLSLLIGYMFFLPSGCFGWMASMEIRIFMKTKNYVRQVQPWCSKALDV